MNWKKLTESSSETVKNLAEKGKAQEAKELQELILKLAGLK